MSDKLKILETNRDALLLAEMGGWLHNIGKFSESFIKSKMAAQGPTDDDRDVANFAYQYVFRVLQWHFQNDPSLFSKIFNGHEEQAAQKAVLVNEPGAVRFFDHRDFAFFAWAHEKKVATEKSGSLEAEHHSVAEIVEFQHKVWHTDNRVNRILSCTSCWMPRLLQQSHHAASGAEKMGHSPHKDTLPACVSSVFGYETLLETRRWEEDRRVYTASVQSQNRADLRKTGQRLLRSAIAETRRPINDITLWDISSTVAALYKAVLAKALLDGAVPGEAVRWRILRVGVDGPEFYGRAARLPDLLARRDLLETTLDAVRTLLEEEYPIGNEIYRDEYGSAFIVPDLKEETNGSLIKGLFQERIEKLFREKLEGELLPHLVISSADEQALTLGEMLKESVPSSAPDVKKTREGWKDETGRDLAADVCPVCGLRPQATSGKAKERKVCDLCEKRRQDRSLKWINRLDNTIWLDEVADRNGRFALIAAGFDIDDWLTSNGQIKTLLVRPPDISGEGDGFKSASFARLRRVSDTTQQFWQAIADDLPGHIGLRFPRLKIVVNVLAVGEDKIAIGHAYELETSLGRIAVVCARNEPIEFLTAENLDGLARRLDIKEEQGHSVASTIRDRLMEKTRAAIRQPSGYGSPGTGPVDVTIIEVTVQSTPYLPALPILNTPRTFMALVPADRALTVVQAIRAKYENEMGKVRNRLPVTVGLVFADRRTPLTAVLDAGRRMLTQPKAVERWQLHADAISAGRNCILAFTNGITWQIPAVMGDGKTEDIWYPYFLTDGKPEGQGKWVKQKSSGRWLVHVSELRKGNTVFVTPSRFDFEYLDASARRFEISYRADGRRRDGGPRPYYLEEITDIERIWELLRTRLATSQIKAIEGLFETSRQAWREEGSATFHGFAHDVLANAGWQEGRPPGLDALCDETVNGRLCDVIELYMDILKQRPKSEEATHG